MESRAIIRCLAGCQLVVSYKAGDGNAALNLLKAQPFDFMLDLHTRYPKMRDFVTCLCILASFAVGSFFVMSKADQWMYWPIFFSFMSLVALITTPVRYGPMAARQLFLPFRPTFLQKIPEPVQKAIAVFLAALIGGLLAAIATKFGLPLGPEAPTGTPDEM